MKKNLKFRYSLEADTINDNLKFCDNQNIDLSQMDRNFLLRLIGYSERNNPSQIFIFEDKNLMPIVFNDYILAFCFNFWGAILSLKAGSNEEIVFNVDGLGGCELEVKYEYFHNKIHYKKAILIKQSTVIVVYEFNFFANNLQLFCLKVWNDLLFYYPKLLNNKEYLNLEYFFKNK